MISTWLRLSYRELTNNWRFSVFFVANLASGLVGLILITTLLHSIHRSLSERSQHLLGADLSVSTRRTLTASELQQLRGALPPDANLTSIVDFFSMLEVGQDSRLVQVRAAEPSYPFYGGLRLAHLGTLGESAASHLEAKQSRDSVLPQAWVGAEVVSELGLKQGQKLEIGGVPFVLADTVEEDSTQGLLTLAAAPRILVSRGALDSKYLDGRGTTLRYSWLIRVPSGVAVDPVKKRIEALFDDPAVRVQTHQESSEGLSRLLTYFSDYLALVSLASLALACLGVVYQFRRFFLSRCTALAILRSLGATFTQTMALLLLELSVLALLGSLSALLVSKMVLPWLEKVVTPLSGIAFSAQLDSATALQALGFGIGLSLLLCLPQIGSLRGLTAQSLFQEVPQFELGRVRWMAYLPAVALFAFVTVWFSHSYWTGSVFLVGLAASAVLLAWIPWFVIQRLSRLGGTLPTRLALLHLSRNPASTLLASVCLGLVTLVGSLIPQLRSSVLQEIQAPSETERPRYFLLDIQPEQLQPLTTLLQTQGLDLRQPSALVRGRLVSENGVAVTRGVQSATFSTREDEREAAFRNRGFNLSYRGAFSGSETLYSGVPFSSTLQPIPEISVEYRFAKQLGWKLGDVMEFDVAGERVRGKIVNLRTVKWTSFQPNFFVVFQPGVLEGLPAVFIGTLGDMAHAFPTTLIPKVTKAFPNISVIPIEKVLTRLYALSEQMIGALFFTTAWVVVAALLTLYSIARYEAFSRRRDMNLLKVLGGSRSLVRGVFFTESAILSLVCSLLGVGIGLGLAFVLVRYGLGGTWAPEPVSLVAAVGLAFLWVQLETVLVARQVWRTRPKELLAAARG